MPYVLPEHFDDGDFSSVDFIRGFKQNGLEIKIPAGLLAGPVTPPLLASNSSAVNGALLAAAIAEANAAGGYVRLPSGRFSMKCAITTGCVIEWTPTTVLLQEQGESVLDIDLSGSAVGPYAITSAAMSENAASSGASSNKFLKLTLTTAADSANFQTGDAVMICSRDARTYYTGDTNYAGEMFFVASVESGLVYLAGNSYLNGVGTLYTTNFVAYRLSRATTDQVRLIRPQVEVNGDPFLQGVAGTWPGSIQIKAAVRPVVENLRINSAWSIGLYFKSCAAFKVTNDHIKNCIGDPANNRYGYGILARGACNAFHVSGGYTELCRHAFTTDCREASSWLVANVWDHGDCTDGVVDGIVALPNGAPPFDTHENSVHTTFTNCRVIGARFSPLGITAATGNGFNVRGPWDKVINCGAAQSEGGVNIAATGLIHEVAGTNIVDGFEFWGEATNNLAGYAITIAGNASETTPQRVAIRNFRAGSASRCILVDPSCAAHVTFHNCHFRGFIDTFARLQGTGIVEFIDCHVDFTETGTGERGISIDNSNTMTLVLLNFSIRSKNGTTPSNAAGGTSVVVVDAGANCTLNFADVFDVRGGTADVIAGAGTIGGGALTAMTNV